MTYFLETTHRFRAEHVGNLLRVTFELHPEIKVLKNDTLAKEFATSKKAPRSLVNQS